MSLLSQMQMHLAAPAQLQGTEGKGFVAPLQNEIVARLSQSDAKRAKPNEFLAAKD